MEGNPLIRYFSWY